VLGYGAFGKAEAAPTSSLHDFTAAQIPSLPPTQRPIRPMSPPNIMPTTFKPGDAPPAAGGLLGLSADNPHVSPISSKPGTPLPPLSASSGSGRRLSRASQSPPPPLGPQNSQPPMGEASTVLLQQPMSFATPPPSIHARNSSIQSER